MSETPSCTIHAAPMVLKQGERGKTFWTCQWCDNESTERLRSMCESAKPEDHQKFKELWQKREAERYWFYDYLCDGCKARISKAIIARKAPFSGEALGRLADDMLTDESEIERLTKALEAIAALPLGHHDFKKIAKAALRTSSE